MSQLQGLRICLSFGDTKLMLLFQFLSQSKGMALGNEGATSRLLCPGGQPARWLSAPKVGLRWLAWPTCSLAPGALSCVRAVLLHAEGPVLAGEGRVLLHTELRAGIAPSQAEAQPV